jgi:DNA-binding Lrp family transcriptional regulator
MDALDRRIVNALQGGFPLSPRPYADAAERLGIEEDDLIDRIRRLLDDGVLSRFGPLFDAERLGGAVTLAAMAVPEERFEAVTEIVNGFAEVAHNYRREHRLNMWFVVACDRPPRIAEVIAEIEDLTGLAVLDLPKEEEFFLELKLSA